MGETVGQQGAIFGGRESSQGKVRTHAQPEHSEAFNLGTKSLRFSATEETN